MKSKKCRVITLLDWMENKMQGDTRVTVGCKTCKEVANLMASTARCAWYPSHMEHEIWIKNPFKRKAK